MVVVVVMAGFRGSVGSIWQAQIQGQSLRDTPAGLHCAASVKWIRVQICCGGLTLHLCNVPGVGSLPDEEGEGLPHPHPHHAQLGPFWGEESGSLSVVTRREESEPEGAPQGCPGQASSALLSW